MNVYNAEGRYLLIICEKVFKIIYIKHLQDKKNVKEKVKIPSLFIYRKNRKCKELLLHRDKIRKKSKKFGSILNELIIDNIIGSIELKNEYFLFVVEKWKLLTKFYYCDKYRSIYKVEKVHFVPYNINIVSLNNVIKNSLSIDDASTNYFINPYENTEPINKEFEVVTPASLGIQEEQRNEVVSSDKWTEEGWENTKVEENSRKPLVDMTNYFYKNEQMLNEKKEPNNVEEKYSYANKSEGSMSEPDEFVDRNVFNPFEDKKDPELAGNSGKPLGGLKEGSKERDGIKKNKQKFQNKKEIEIEMVERKESKSLVSSTGTNSRYFSNTRTNPKREDTNKKIPMFNSAKKWLTNQFNHKNILNILSDITNYEGKEDRRTEADAHMGKGVTVAGPNDSLSGEFFNKRKESSNKSSYEETVLKNKDNPKDNSGNLYKKYETEEEQEQENSKKNKEIDLKDMSINDSFDKPKKRRFNPVKFTNISNERKGSGKNDEKKVESKMEMLKILKSIQKLLSIHMYYSYDYDLTQNVQMKSKLNITEKEIEPMNDSNVKKYSLLEKSEKKFIWNYEMIKNMKNRSKIDNNWFCSLIQGYISYTSVEINKKCLELLLISRRSTILGGTRFNHRGMNDDGHVANYIETEQIIRINNKNVLINKRFIDSSGSPLLLSNLTNTNVDPVGNRKNARSYIDPFIKKENVKSNNTSRFNDKESLIDLGNTKKQNISFMDTLNNTTKDTTWVDDGKNIFENRIISLVQIRGSMPLFWQQHAISSNVQIQRSSLLSIKAFKEHNKKLINNYGNQIYYINLLSETKNNEKKLTKKMLELMNYIKKDKYYQEKDYIHYVGYDFHTCVKNKGFEDAMNDFINKVLLKNIENVSFYMEETKASEQNLNANFQKGVIRTNCLDCLDRTNVFQYYYCWFFISYILKISNNEMFLKPFKKSQLCFFKNANNLFNREKIIVLTTLPLENGLLDFTELLTMNKKKDLTVISNEGNIISTTATTTTKNNNPNNKHNNQMDNHNLRVTTIPSCYESSRRMNKSEIETTESGRGRVRFVESEALTGSRLGNNNEKIKEELERFEKLKRHNDWERSCSKEDIEEDVILIFKQLFKKMWVENGDAISTHYTGTGSVFSSQVNFGKSSISTNIDHVIKSIERFYQNNFEDNFRQECIDIILGKGKFKNTKHSNYERLSYLLDFGNHSKRFHRKKYNTPATHNDSDNENTDYTDDSSEEENEQNKGIPKVKSIKKNKETITGTTISHKGRLLENQTNKNSIEEDSVSESSSESEEEEENSKLESDSYLDSQSNSRGTSISREEMVSIESGHSYNSNKSKRLENETEQDSYHSNEEEDDDDVCLQSKNKVQDNGEVEENRNSSSNSSNGRKKEWKKKDTNHAASWMIQSEKKKKNSIKQNTFEWNDSTKEKKKKKKDTEKEKRKEEMIHDEVRSDFDYWKKKKLNKKKSKNVYTDFMKNELLENYYYDDEEYEEINKLSTKRMIQNNYEEKIVKLWLGSWNLCGNDLYELNDISSWLNKYEECVDLYVFCFQEVVELTGFRVLMNMKDKYKEKKIEQKISQALSEISLHQRERFRKEKKDAKSEKIDHLLDDEDLEVIDCSSLKRNTRKLYEPYVKKPIMNLSKMERSVNSLYEQEKERKAETNFHGFKKEEGRGIGVGEMFNIKNANEYLQEERKERRWLGEDNKNRFSEFDFDSSQRKNNSVNKNEMYYSSYESMNKNSEQEEYKIPKNNNRGIPTVASKKKYKYVKLKSVSMIGLFIVIFIDEGLVDDIREIEVCKVKVGLKGNTGNKGSVSIKFRLGFNSFCFNNIHLASGQTNIFERNTQMLNILNNTFQNEEVNNLFNFDYFFACGDFNFRINKNPIEVIHLIENNQIDQLLSNDQFIYNKMYNILPFCLFYEYPITFNPTYKFKKNSNMYDIRRIPAWCDRILLSGKLVHLSELEKKRQEKKKQDKEMSMNDDIQIGTGETDEKDDSNTSNKEKCVDNEKELNFEENDKIYFKYDYYKTHNNFFSSDHKPISAVINLKVFFDKPEGEEYKYMHSFGSRTNEDLSLVYNSIASNSSNSKVTEPINTNVDMNDNKNILDYIFPNNSVIGNYATHSLSNLWNYSSDKNEIKNESEKENVAIDFVSNDLSNINPYERNQFDSNFVNSLRRTLNTPNKNTTEINKNRQRIFESTDHIICDNNTTATNNNNNNERKELSEEDKENQTQYPFPNLIDL